MNITITDFIYACTCIGVVGTAIKLLYSANNKMKEPYEKVVERLDHHDKCLKKDNERIELIEEKISINAEDNRQTLLCLETILSHLETGNNTGQIKSQRDDLNRYLIKRK